MRDALLHARAALDQLLSDQALVDRAAAMPAILAGCLNKGGKILTCGNGGSACDAAHFCEELTGRFRKDRRPLAALACTEPGHLTCVANDFGFEHVFARWVAALARPGDAVILLSTSGNSENIVRAARAGREAGATTVALLGGDGGRAKGLCDHDFIVPGQGSDRVQELHMLILHAWVEGIERSLGLA